MELQYNARLALYLSYNYTYYVPHFNIFLFCNLVDTLIQVDKIKNVIIWGNHSSTQYPDAAHATVALLSGVKAVSSEINDDEWLNNTFVETIQKRGAAVIAARKMSSAMSAAKAAGDHMRDWWFGTKPGEWVSMGVVSDGSYGIPKDVVFSFPVTIEDKRYEIVQVSYLSHKVNLESLHHIQMSLL